MILRSGFIFYLYLLNIYYILSILSTGFPDKSSGFPEKLSVFPEKDIRVFGKLFPDFRKIRPGKRILIFKYPKNRNHRDKKASGRHHSLLGLNILWDSPLVLFCASPYLILIIYINILYYLYFPINFYYPIPQFLIPDYVKVC